MTEKMVKDLKPGDRVELADDGIATIVNVSRNYLIGVFGGDVAYDVKYTDDRGVTGTVLVGGKSLAVVGTPGSPE